MPALLMGFSFPLANAVIQHAEQLGRPPRRHPVSRQHRGRRLRQPRRRLRPAADARAPGERDGPDGRRGARDRAAVLRLQPPATASIHPRSSLGGARSLMARRGARRCGCCFPPDHVTARAIGTLPSDEQRARRSSDGLTEVIAVTERPGAGRTLNTNGHRCRRRRRSRSATCARWPTFRCSRWTRPRRCW